MRRKRRLRVFFNAGILVEFVGRVGEFLGRFLRRLAVADIVVAVTVGGGAQGSAGELVSAVVAEAVAAGRLHTPPLRAGSRAF